MSNVRFTGQVNKKSPLSEKQMINVKFSAFQLITVIILMAVIGNAVAQDVLKRKTKATTPHFSFNGVGTHSCGVYIENLKGLNAENFKFLYQQWGAGFMAGASNEGLGANPVTDLETYTAWLDKWCADDPSSNVAFGIIALGKRLSERQ